MAGTVASIISLELDKDYSERKIVKALKAANARSDKTVLPAGNGYAYIVVKNRLKAQAEADLMEIIGLYKGFGGQEFNEDVLPADAPKPEIRGLDNSGVPYIHYESKPLYLHPNGDISSTPPEGYVED